MKGLKLLLVAIAAQLSFTIYAKVNVAVEVLPQLSSRPSWSGGVNLEIPISDKLFLSPGIFYSTRHKYDKSSWETIEYHPDGVIPISYEKASINTHGDYIHIPFLLGFNSFPHGSYTIKIAAGMYYACLLGGKSKIKMDDNGNESEMIMSSFGTAISKRSDFGLCVEAKCLIHRHYQIGINLQHGLIKIYQGYAVAGIQDPFMFHRLGPGVQFHQSIGLSLGYLF